VVVAVLVPVDEQKVMDAGSLLVGPAFPVAVPQRGEGEHERGEPLLAVDDEPALHPPCGDPLRSQYDGPQEVGRRRSAFQLVLDQLLHVVPQLLELLPLPAVRTLLERDLKLHLALDQLAERDLPSLHVHPLRRVVRGRPVIVPHPGTVIRRIDELRDRGL
jgi:hypothetical protein